MARVSASRLDRRVNLLRRVLAPPDAQGYPVSSYASYAQVWAAKNDLAGTRRIIAQQVTEQQMTEFTIRYRKDVHLTDRLQLVETASIFDITGLGEIGRHDGLSLLCRENPEASQAAAGGSGSSSGSGSGSGSGGAGGSSGRSGEDMMAGIGSLGVPDSTAVKGTPNDGDSTAAVRAVLIADPAVTAICGTRIYPLAAPQGTPFPYVVLTTTSVYPFNDLVRFSTPDRDEVELSAWSNVSPLESETLARTCRKSLEAAHVLCTGAVIPLFSADVEPPVFRTGYFFQIWQ